MHSSPPVAGAPSARTIGNHRLVAGLGKGGMARVYLALAQRTGGFTKLLVLKVLRAELDADGGFLDMFMQEARLAARLNHPNVVQTYEVGEDAGRHYIAMEYLEGQALNAIISRVGRDRFPLGVHLRILCDALEGLQYAHDLADYDGTPLGIVHRDVSPQNVFVTYTGQSKILDFGIAKAYGSTQTATGILKGKVGYMAPEQAAGTPDRRADVFAVGVMLWEALAGRRFIGARVDDVVALTRRISGKDPRVRDVAPNVPAALADICDKATETEPGERYPTAAAMRSAIEDYLRSVEPVDARTVAALLAETYAEERARLRSLIDDQVKRADHTGPMIDINTHLTVTPLIDSSIDVDMSAEAAGSQVQPTSGTRAKRSSKAVLYGATVVLLVAGVTLALRRGKEPSIAPVLVAPQQPSSLATDSPSAQPSSAGPAAPVMINVAVRTTPPSATLQLDGETVTNPYRIDVAKDGSHHVVIATARGYASETISLSYDGPRDLVVALKPAMVVVPPRPTSDIDLTTVKSKRPKRTVDEKDPYH